jgi:cell wall-associated NlpC family hydrolase
MPQTQKSTAVEKLAPSRLDSAKQMQLLGGDVDVDDFHLQMRQGAGIQIESAITDATIDRTVDGASTLTVNVDDDNNRNIQLSGMLGHGVDVNLDGLYFTLVGVRKTGRAVTLTFEEREVNLLRRYKKFIQGDRNHITRAQFVLRMIREVRETKLKWCIPELHIKQPQSDITANQYLVGSDLQPLDGSQQVPDAMLAAQERQKGIAHNNNRLTVKGAKATPEQIKNADIILKTGESMRAPRKVLIASIMVAITESTIHNYAGGLGGAHGVFQQTPPWWPASGNVATDAAAFFKRCIAMNISNPKLSYAMLCQSVQQSGAGAHNGGANYAPWQAEGANFVDEFDHNPTSSVATQLAVGNQVAQGSNLFIRGQITSAKGMSGAYVFTPENSWNCMQRLAQEVNWRCFVVSGRVYFISEHWLFKSKPFMTISEDSQGIDWIDYDYDEGKHKATCTVTAHLSRWSAPPGSTIDITNMGIIDGKYLVEEVSRSLYDPTATITLSKPLPILPEPLALSGVPSGLAPTAGKPSQDLEGDPSLKNANAVQKFVVTYAHQQLGVPYVWGGEIPGIEFDCSGLTQSAYSGAGINLPRTSQQQWAFGRKLGKNEPLLPGDLVFFEMGSGGPGHVGIYIGGPNMIDAPHTGAKVRLENYHWDTYVGATRPWDK